MTEAGSNEQQRNSSKAARLSTVLLWLGWGEIFLLFLAIFLQIFFEQDVIEWVVSKSFLKDVDEPTRLEEFTANFVAVFIGIFIPFATFASRMVVEQKRLIPILAEELRSAISKDIESKVAGVVAKNIQCSYDDHVRQHAAKFVPTIDAVAAVPSAAKVTLNVTNTAAEIFAQFSNDNPGDRFHREITTWLVNGMRTRLKARSEGLTLHGQILDGTDERDELSKLLERVTTESEHDSHSGELGRVLFLRGAHKIDDVRVGFSETWKQSLRKEYDTTGRMVPAIFLFDCAPENGDIGSSLKEIKEHFPFDYLRGYAVFGLGGQEFYTEVERFHQNLGVLIELFDHRVFSAFQLELPTDYHGLDGMLNGNQKHYIYKTTSLETRSPKSNPEILDLAKSIKSLEELDFYRQKNLWEFTELAKRIRVGMCGACRLVGPDEQGQSALIRRLVDYALRNAVMIERDA